MIECRRPRPSLHPERLDLLVELLPLGGLPPPVALLVRPLQRLLAAPHRQGEFLHLGCNSIDISNLRLELGFKLEQGLKTRLGMHSLAAMVKAVFKMSIELHPRAARP